MFMFMMATALAASPVETADPVSAKVVCKRTYETGSIVRKRRICLTRAQWDYLAEEHYRFAKAMILKGQGEAQ